MGNELQKELEKMNNEIAKHEDYLKSEKTTYGLADLINGKIPSKQLPSDVNLTANTLEEMNALVTNGSVTDGQLCYCKADKKLYVLKDNVWVEVGGGGGKSVPPTLNLLDLSSGDPTVRTSITEEEKQNIEKGLYNSVFYIDASLGESAIYSIYFPEKATSSTGDFIFSIYNIEATEGEARIKSSRVYSLGIGEKNPDETYPITIRSLIEIPFGSGGGITPKSITSTTDYASLSDTDYLISVNITGNNNVKDGTYILYGNKANGYSYWYSEDKSEGLNMQTYWHYIHYDSTGLTAIIFTSFLDITDNNKVGFSFNSNFPNNNIFGGFSVKQIPLFSKYTLVTNTSDEITPILPCTTADNGKVLSVVNGEAQWASAGGSGSIPPLPSDASTSTYVLKAINGTIKWVKES